MEDQQIIQLFWDRNNGAIPAAQEKYGASLLRLAERLLGSREDAEECVNDTYLNTWNAIPPERPDRLFAYLARVCRNLAFDRLDWKNARKRQADIITLSAELETCIPDRRREAAVDGREIGAALTAFLRELPEEQRLVFLRRYWYGDDIAAIAKAMHMGHGAVKSALFRARTSLKSYLEQEGIDL